MRSLIVGVLVAIAGLALGLYATRAALVTPWPIAVERLGPWRIEASAGAGDADPYTRARVERDGEIPLALGEGLRLTTTTDDDGRPLDAACVYRVGPRMPPTRFWTLELADRGGQPIANLADRYVLRSSEILREADGAFSIWVSLRAHAGNWLPVGRPARFALTLRLYDPALSGAAIGAETRTPPLVQRVKCG